MTGRQCRVMQSSACYLSRLKKKIDFVSQTKLLYYLDRLGFSYKLISWISSFYPLDIKDLNVVALCHTYITPS